MLGLAEKVRLCKKVHEIVENIGILVDFAPVNHGYNRRSFHVQPIQDTVGYPQNERFPRITLPIWGIANTLKSLKCSHFLLISRYSYFFSKL